MRRIAATKLAVLAVAVPMKTEPAKADCQTLTCVERVNRKQCDERHFARCLDRAALTYRVDRRWLYRVSFCESRWNRYARNPSGATSYFQFLPSTWATTPYARHSIYSPKYQALAAAFMLRAGRSREWVCA